MSSQSPTNFELPGDLASAIEGLDVSVDLVMKYCGGIREEHSHTRAMPNYHSPATPEVPRRATAVAVLDLEAMLEG